MKKIYYEPENLWIRNQAYYQLQTEEIDEEEIDDDEEIDDEQIVRIAIAVVDELLFIFGVSIGGYFVYRYVK